MEAAVYVVIALSFVMIVCIGVLVVFLLYHQPTPRPRPPMAHSVSAGSSSRSRMAARWAHMERGMDDPPHKSYQDVDYETTEVTPPYEPNDASLPNEFGTIGGLTTKRVPNQASHASLTSSLVGTGPNGTRTFLMGWFGLDEPTFSGLKMGSDDRGKEDLGEVLAMSPPGEFGTARRESEGPNSVRHHRVPTAEDDDWETRSAHESHS